MRSLQFHRYLPSLLALLFVSSVSAEPIPVRYTQGTVHGFLVLKDLGGRRIATGDSIQTVHGDRVTAQVIFHFRDGSLDDETTVFTQDKELRLISDHHIQHGPSFPHPVDVLIDGATGKITYHDKDGAVKEDHLDLEADVANGLPSDVLMNIDPAAAETKVSYVAAGEGKPRLIHLSIKSGGEVPFFIGGVRRKAVDYILHVEIGGVAGVIAPIIGKVPPDQHVWILTGPAPVFIRQQGPLYEGGPTWRMEQTSATFSQ